MPWRHLLFNTIYRIGRPIWDILTPPEITDVVEGAHALKPGRALDLGCGTSPNVAYLAQHGTPTESTYAQPVIGGQVFFPLAGAAPRQLCRC